MGTFCSKAGRALLRLLLRWWALVIVLVLCLLAALSVYQMANTDMMTALAVIPRLLVYLLLIAAVIAIRYAGKRWGSALYAKGKDGLQRQVAYNVWGHGKSHADDALQRGTARARGILTGANERMRRQWTDIAGRSRGVPVTVARRQSLCRHCQRGLRPGARFCDGCGKALMLACRMCGRALRPGARFCDGCGSAVRSG